MQHIESNPAITHFILFSGGGGLLTRSVDLTLSGGDSRVTVRGVPASVDPETVSIDFAQAEVTLREFTMKKPNQQYVNDNLRRESGCAQTLIDTSIELGTHRPALLEVCESVMMRTYLDEEIELELWLVTPGPLQATLTLSYFIDDVRFRWKPTMVVELDESGESATIKGMIAITNESAHRLNDVEVSFADFAKDMSETQRLEPQELKAGMRKRRMKMMMLK